MTHRPPSTPPPAPPNGAITPINPRAMKKIQAHFHKIQQILRALKGAADANDLADLAAANLHDVSDLPALNASFAHHLQGIWALLSDLPLLILDDAGHLQPLRVADDQRLSPLHPLDRVRLKLLSLPCATPPALPSDLSDWDFDALMSLLHDLLSTFQQSLDLTVRLARSLLQDPSTLPQLLQLLSSPADASLRAHLLSHWSLPDDDSIVPSLPPGEKPN
jgi:hypothetical protein